MNALEKHEELLKISYDFIEKEIKFFENNPQFYDLKDGSMYNIELRKYDETTKAGFIHLNLNRVEEKQEIQRKYWELLNLSYEENFHFFGCVLKVAIIHYDKVIKENLNPTFGINESDILKSELNDLTSMYNLFMKKRIRIEDDLNAFKSRHRYEVEYSPYVVMYCENSKFDVPIWKKEYLKKVKYLKDRINGTLHYNTTKEDEPVNQTAKNKVLYLNELGVINFINQKDNNKNNAAKLSRLLSKITGEKPEALRRAISSILRNELDPNNPYIIEEDVTNAKNYIEKEKLIIK